MADAIILDGHLKSALAAARSLARTGIAVKCGAIRASAPALHSRACSVAFRYPNPLTNLDGFIAAVNAHAGPGSVVFTFSDQTTLALSRHRSSLASGIKLLMPSAETVETVFNKARFADIAEGLGIQVPESISSAGAYPDDAERFGYPVVLKPRFNCFWHFGRGVSASTSVAFNRKDAVAAFGRLRELSGESPLVQKWIPGREYGATAVCRDGEILSLSAHRRLRSLSSFGGASTAKVTIKVPTAFQDVVERIIRHFSWTGPAMFEFKGEEGSFTLLEMNGRFWGSLPLAVIAGTDFPLLAFQAATNSTFTGKQAGKIGVYSRHLTGDAARILRINGMARFSAMWAFLRGFFPPFHDDVFIWSDPLPWCWDLWDSIIR